MAGNIAFNITSFVKKELLLLLTLLANEINLCKDNKQIIMKT